MVKSQAARRKSQAAALVTKKEAGPRKTPPAERSLETAFVDDGGHAVDASAKEWASFWANKPGMVGIDAEGTHLEPPLLLQIAKQLRLVSFSEDTRRGRTEG